MGVADAVVGSQGDSVIDKAPVTRLTPSRIEIISLVVQLQNN